MLILYQCQLFGFDDCTMVTWGSVLIFRKYALKESEVTGYHVCILFPNGLGKKICIHIQEKGQSKRARILTTGEPGKGYTGILVAFL